MYGRGARTTTTGRKRKIGEEPTEANKCMAEVLE